MTSTAFNNSAAGASVGGSQSNAGLLFLMSACAALVFGLGASLNLAVDRIATSPLQPSASQVLWIVDTYLVVFGCLLIPSGALGDRFGRKAALMAGLLLLAAGSALSLASTIPWLLCGRGVAGAGAALILPNSLALLVQSMEGVAQRRAIAVWTGMGGLGGALGNILGGLVLQFFDWQALFAFAIPLALVAWLLAGYLVPRRAGQPNPIDVPGTFVLLCGVFTLLKALIDGQHAGWVSAPVLALFAATFVFAVLFVLVERHRQHPLIDPQIFRNRRLGAGMLGVAFSFIGMYSVFFLNGQYLMSAKEYSPIFVGLSILPMCAVMFWLSPRSLWVAKYLGSRATVGLGMLALALGLYLLSLCTPDTGYLFYAFAVSVIGVGSSLSNPLLSLGILASLPPGKSGMASGLNSFTREIGGAVGIALFGSLLGNALTARLIPEPQGLAKLASPAGHAVQQTISAHLAVLRHTGADPALLHAAQWAFTNAMAEALHVVFALTVAATILVVMWYSADNKGAS
ncbi:MFS transporter [Desulfovibrio desulfuricans]|uniref:MFS transporter n=1 Tax=Desulfovibrio desulfuricans TaxID=876 RepID=A0A4P7UIE7_DESDE|nr:MFS transporter [Desulfovibrio desulfuricans]QCC86143.1 MFS transporter [Desulfovibrio desulfuricans]